MRISPLRRHTRRRAAFTLVEVLVAMTVALLITGQVFSVLRSQLRAEDLQVDLRRAIHETQSLSAQRSASVPDAPAVEEMEFNEQQWTFFPLRRPASGAFFFQPRPAP